MPINQNKLKKDIPFYLLSLKLKTIQSLVIYSNYLHILFQ